MIALRTCGMTIGAIAAATIAAFGPAQAHPHIWISVQSTVVYENGTVIGLRQRWTFDEFYSSMAIQGLDTNGDGVYDRQELHELAKVNIEGLKQFGYFTFPKLGDQQLEVSEPTDFFMELTQSGQAPGPGGETAAEETKESGGFWSKFTQSLTGGATAEEKPQVLALEFNLPLQKPVLAEADGFNFATYDASFFIWFDLAKDKPIQLSDGAPQGCKAAFEPAVAQEAPSPQPQSQSLADAAAEAESGFTFNVGQPRTVTVSCTR